MKPIVPNSRVEHTIALEVFAPEIPQD